MRQVGIDHIEPGMATARHVFPPGEVGGVPLLAASVVITEAILNRLKKAGVGIVMVDDEFSHGIEAIPPLTDDTRRAAISILKDSFQSMGHDSGALGPDQMEGVEGVISRIITEVATRRNLLVCLSDLNIFGGDRMAHALNVCVVGSAIARTFFKEHGWKDFRGQRREDGVDDRMVKLGVGLLLQDIGMLAVPETVREKGGILSAEERAIMQQHPLLGLELLEGSDLSPLTKVAIAQHHERFDGSGYPRGLARDDLHDHGQIAAIAECYVSLCDQASGEGKAFEPHEAYRIILQARGKLFRPEVVDAFAAAIAPYGPGATVQLTDGRFGVVVGNHGDAPLLPVIRVTHEHDGSVMSPPVEVDLRPLGGKLAVQRATKALPGDRDLVVSGDASRSN